MQRNQATHPRAKSLVGEKLIKVRAGRSSSLSDLPQASTHAPTQVGVGLQAVPPQRQAIAAQPRPETTSDEAIEVLHKQLQALVGNVRNAQLHQQMTALLNKLSDPSPGQQKDVRLQLLTELRDGVQQTLDNEQQTALAQLALLQSKLDTHLQDIEDEEFRRDTTQNLAVAHQQYPDPQGHQVLVLQTLVSELLINAEAQKAQEAEQTKVLTQQELALHQEIAELRTLLQGNAGASPVYTSLEGTFLAEQQRLSAHGRLAKRVVLLDQAIGHGYDANKAVAECMATVKQIESQDAELAAALDDALIGATYERSLQTMARRLDRANQTANDALAILQQARCAERETPPSGDETEMLLVGIWVGPELRDERAQLLQALREQMAKDKLARKNPSPSPEHSANDFYAQCWDRALVMEKEAIKHRLIQETIDADLANVKRCLEDLICLPELCSREQRLALQARLKTTQRQREQGMQPAAYTPDLNRLSTELLDLLAGNGEQVQQMACAAIASAHSSTEQSLQALSADERLALVQGLRLGGGVSQDDTRELLTKVYQQLALDDDFAQHDEQQREQCAAVVFSDPGLQKVRAQLQGASRRELRAQTSTIVDTLRACLALHSKQLDFEAPPLKDASGEFRQDAEVSGKGNDKHGGFSFATGEIDLNFETLIEDHASFDEVLLTALHENTHAYQDHLVHLLEAGQLQPGEPRYQQARLFQLNIGKHGYLDDGLAYAKQPTERHTFLAQEDYRQKLAKVPLKPAQADAQHASQDLS